MYLLAEKRPSHQQLSFLEYISNGKKVQLRLIYEISPHWQSVALTLDFSIARIAITEKTHVWNPVEAATDMLTQWMAKDPQHCWAKLINALREVELHVVANDLEQALISEEYVEGTEGESTTAGTLECTFTNTLLLSHYLHFMYSLWTGIHTEFRVLGGEDVSTSCLWAYCI